MKIKIKSKLTKYITNPKHTQLKRIDKYDEMGNLDSGINMILKDFPNNGLELVPEKIMAEILSFYASLYEYVNDMDEMIKYLEDSITYCDKVFERYYNNLAKAKRDVSILSHKQLKGSEPTYYTRAIRQGYGYTLEMIDIVLEQQRITHNYYQYTDGYYLYRYRAYAWLKRELTLTLSELKKLQDK